MFAQSNLLHKLTDVNALFAMNIVSYEVYREKDCMW